MTSLTMPTISVQVAFQDTPYATSPVWTDVTRWVLGLSTTMGRQHELNQVAPSTATLQIDNQDGRFSPWNTGSPYYYTASGLAPGHPVKITATWLGVTYPVFRGVTKSWVPTYGATRATMTLACYDILALLNFNSLDNTTYSILPMASANDYWPLDDPIGSTQASDDKGTHPALNNGAQFGVAGAFPTSSATGVLFPSILTNLVTAAAVSTAAAMSVDLWVNTTTATTTLFKLGAAFIDFYLGLTSGYVTATVKGTTTTAISPNVADGQWHHVALTYSGSVVQLYVDGVPVRSGTATGTVTSAFAYIGIANASQSMAQVALYPLELTPAQIASQYAIGSAGFVTQDTGARTTAVLQVAGVPSAMYSIGTGTTTVQGSSSSLAATSVMSYLNTVMSSERGILYQDAGGTIRFLNRHYPYESANANTNQFTFGYATGQLHYYPAGLVPGMDDIDIWNNVQVGRNGGVTQTAADTTSQTNYGRRTMNATGLLFLNDLDSMGLAQGMLLEYKNAKARVRSMTVDNTIGAGAALPAMLGLDLQDRITINWRPIDGSTVDFTQASLVEQISHTVTPSTWTTTLAVSPVGTETFWRLDMTALDNTVPTGLGF